MSKHVSVSPKEAGDRLALRELVESYAHCADRRDAKGQMALFTADTHFVVYMDAKDPKPSQELNSREALAPVFADLNKYATTMHFLGQTTILTLTDDRGTAETYCMPHHLTINGAKRQLNESAGKRKSSRIPSGNVYLKSGLVEAANAAARSKGTYLRDKFFRLKARRGYKRAVVAIAHKILVAI